MPFSLSSPVFVSALVGFFRLSIIVTDSSFVLPYFLASFSANNSFQSYTLMAFRNPNSVLFKKGSNLSAVIPCNVKKPQSIKGKPMIMTIQLEISSPNIGVKYK